MALNVEIHIEELELHGIPEHRVADVLRALASTLEVRLAAREGGAFAPLDLPHLDLGTVTGLQPADLGAAVGEALARRVRP